MLAASKLLFAVVGADADSAAVIGSVCEHLSFPAPAVCASVEDLSVCLRGRSCYLMFVDACQAERALSYAAQAEERPKIVLLSESCSARAAFSFAQRGVDALLEQPVDILQILKCLDDVLHGPTALQRVARAQLGRYGLKDAQQYVRQAMLLEALERTGGNRHAAARLLRVDRRAVQLALKELGDASKRANAMLHSGVVPAPSPSLRAELDLTPGAANGDRAAAEDVWRERSGQATDAVRTIGGRASELPSAPAESDTALHNALETALPMAKTGGNRAV